MALLGYRRRDWRVAAQWTLPLALAWIAGFPVESSAQEASAPRPAGVDGVNRTDLARGCGVYATALYLKRNGHPELTYDDVARIVDGDGDGLSSLVDVQRGLREYGVPSFVAQSPAGSGIWRPAIIRLSKGPYDTPQPHLVLVEPASNGQIRVFLPPAGVALWSDRRLAEDWDGYAVFPEGTRNSPVRWLFLGVLGIAAGVVVGAFLLRRPARVEGNG
jgi:hypothetical protein